MMSLCCYEKQRKEKEKYQNNTQSSPYTLSGSSILFKEITKEHSLP